MKIALLMQGGKDWAGGMEYTKSIALALARLPESQRETLQVEAVCGENVPSELIEQLRPVVARIHTDAKIVQRAKPTADMAAKQPGVFKKLFGGTDEHAQPQAEEPMFDFVYPLGKDPAGCNAHRCAAWMWDFQHKYLPQLFTAEDIEARNTKFAKLAEKARTIVFSSEACLKDFRKFFPESKARTEVLRFRAIARDEWFADDPARIVAQYHLPRKYLLVCSQFWQHKNHRVVFDALRLLAKNGVQIPVVFTGLFHDHRNPFYCSELLCEIHEAGLAQSTFLLGLTPREHQIQLVRGALAIVQPSLFEGWSTVVEEARALGKYAMLSDIAVHREQNPPGAEFFRCDDAAGLARLMEQAWSTREPGPDLDAEKQARVRNAEDVNAFAQRFLEIAAG